jgi:sugar O-acyltransferase (sialic acid O-acetyltransferase NeuD family)
MIFENRTCFVIGAGGHCRVLLSILLEPSNQHYEIIGILDLQTPKEKKEIFGIPVIGGVEKLESFSGESPDLFLSIGDNATRKKYFELWKAQGFQFPNLISEKAFISSKVNIGQGNVICPHAHIGPYVTIGDNNIINTRTTLEHESGVGDHCHIAPASLVCGRSQIGDLCFIGAGATIIDYIKVSSETLVGAGSVVVKNIDTSSLVYVGVPAKLIKKR